MSPCARKSPILEISVQIKNNSRLNFVGLIFLKLGIGAKDEGRGGVRWPKAVENFKYFCQLLVYHYISNLYG